MRKTYEKLQKKEQNRVAAAAAAATTGASSDATLSQSGARAPPPSFVPPPRIVPAAVAVTADGDEERAAAAAVAVETAGLDNGGLGAAGAPVCGPFPSDAPCESEVCCVGSGGQSALQVAERLNEAVRLCSVGGVSAEGQGAGREGGGGGGSLGALTLSEAELSRPRRLLHDLRLLSCRPAEEAPSAVLPEADERTNDVEETQSKPGVEAAATAAPPGGKKAEFLSPALAEEEARRVGALPLGHDPLMETAWLAGRFPKVTLGDLLVNRLELSLWASYWDRRRPRESMG